MNIHHAWDWGAPDARLATLLIAETDDADTLAAITATDARLIGRVGWAEAIARLERQSPLQLIALDCAGADDAIVAEALPGIRAFALDNEARIVASFAESQIDLVTASLSGPQVDLLCAPSRAERLTAYTLSLPVGTGNSFADSARNAEAQRLRRLNEEIARIAETLARLSRVDTDAAHAREQVADRRPTFGAAPAETIAPAIAGREVRAAIRARRLRDQFFDAGLFEDPAWDILLDLFAADLERAQVSVSSLCIAAAVAPTTALRWIAKMADAGLLVRVPDPFDRRRAFMELSATAREAMHGYVSAVKRAGLAIA